jgi:hypothetical protein
MDHDDESQPDLFGGVTPAAYEPKAEHVRNRLIDMLAQMRAAERWPWEGVQLDLFRNTVMPYLLRLLPEEESNRWRADIEAEAERLDLAA